MYYCISIKDQFHLFLCVISFDYFILSREQGLNSILPTVIKVSQSSNALFQRLKSFLVVQNLDSSVSADREALKK